MVVKDAGADTYLADQRPKRTTGGLITLAECLRLTIEYTYGIDKESKDILLGSSSYAHLWHCRHTKEH
ncbi:hypothetical protein DPV78_005695 [Talaromyces pinophilus]|nr:hypothetical protein DPV78_005695 [Talaromyces pinophilus]